MLYTEERPQTRDPNPSTPSAFIDRGDGHAADGMDGDAPGYPLPTRPRLEPEPPATAPEPALDVPSHRRPWKKPGKRVQDAYRLTLQVGFVLALMLVLGLTHVDLSTSNAPVIPLETQEVVAMEDIKQTEQELLAPPPPRPVAPIEVPNNTLVETQNLDFDASLDLNAALDTGAPPPEAAPPPKPPEEEEEAEIFVVVEEKPVLVGGLRSLQERVNYPRMAINAGIEGRVIVQFIVDENGDVTHPTVIRGRHPSLDEEALRVIGSATFTPGRQRGSAVKVQMALPITFQLTGGPR